jgi:hypothetical protein
LLGALVAGRAQATEVHLAAVCSQQDYPTKVSMALMASTTQLAAAAAVLAPQQLHQDLP